VSALQLEEQKETAMSGLLHIVYAGAEGRILVTDSCTYCDERVTTTDVIIAGSFAGEIAAAMALRRGARAFLGNAAGIGRDGADVSGLTLGQRLGAPAAALSEQSACLGNGLDSYAHGVIARVNELARALGVRQDMSCMEAATLLLKAPLGVVGRGSEYFDNHREIVYDGPEGQVTTMISVSFATAENAGQVICAGSHTASVTGHYVTAYDFPVAGVICNDAGVGKDQSGIAGLEILNRAGIPAASVAAISACIGSGTSTYEHGMISHCNAVAQGRGVRPGQPAKEACLALLTARAWSASGTRVWTSA
jgi:hypothetical protein